MSAQHVESSLAARSTTDEVRTGVPARTAWWPRSTPRHHANETISHAPARSTRTPKARASPPVEPPSRPLPASLVAESAACPFDDRSRLAEASARASSGATNRRARGRSTGRAIGAHHGPLVGRRAPRIAVCSSAATRRGVAGSQSRAGARTPRRTGGALAARRFGIAPGPPRAAPRARRYRAATCKRPPFTPVRWWKCSVPSCVSRNSGASSVYTPRPTMALSICALVLMPTTAAP